MLRIKFLETHHLTKNTFIHFYTYFNAAELSEVLWGQQRQLTSIFFLFFLLLYFCFFPVMFILGGTKQVINWVQLMGFLLCDINIFSRLQFTKLNDFRIFACLLNKENNHSLRDAFMLNFNLNMIIELKHHFLFSFMSVICLSWANICPSHTVVHEK